MARLLFLPLRLVMILEVLDLYLMLVFLVTALALMLRLHIAQSILMLVFLVTDGVFMLSVQVVKLVLVTRLPVLPVAGMALIIVFDLLAKAADLVLKLGVDALNLVKVVFLAFGQNHFQLLQLRVVLAVPLGESSGMFRLESADAVG